MQDVAWIPSSSQFAWRFLNTDVTVWWPISRTGQEQERCAASTHSGCASWLRCLLGWQHLYYLHGVLSNQEMYQAHSVASPSPHRSVMPFLIFDKCLLRLRVFRSPPPPMPTSILPPNTLIAFQVLWCTRVEAFQRTPRRYNLCNPMCSILSLRMLFKEKVAAGETLWVKECSIRRLVCPHITRLLCRWQMLKSLFYQVQLIFHIFSYCPQCYSICLAHTGYWYAAPANTPPPLNANALLVSVSVR